jgi:predicted DNA-binding transcriptional regulator AlpA
MASNIHSTTNCEPSKTLQKDIEIDTGDRFIREPETRSITGLSKSQRHNLMNQIDEEGKPRFPQKYSLGERASAWLLSDVRSWMASRIVKSCSSNSEANRGEL